MCKYCDSAARSLIGAAGPRLRTWKTSADHQVMKTSPVAGKPVEPRRNGVTKGILTDALADSVKNTFGGATMSKQTRVSHPIYNLLPTEVEGFDSLAELALDMRWSWNHATDKVWRQLDPALWELTQNPWVVLQTVSRDQLERVLADPAYLKNVDDLLRAKHHTAETPAWFQQHHPQAPELV